MNILVIPDQHAHPDYDNKRADWLGKFLLDVRPDCVVNLGDCADMASLSSYDKGRRAFNGRSYAKDIASHRDFQDRVWHPLRHAKKKLPRSIVLEGNHEQRVERALDLSPELTGTLGFNDYGFKDHYDTIVRYEGGTPGTIEIAGITFGHYVTSGVMGRPVGGVHAAYSLIHSQLKSTVVGHSHLCDYSQRANSAGSMVNAVVAGCYFDYHPEWAGKQVTQQYWRGLVMLHNAEGGQFDPEFISMGSLRREYIDR